jgi:FdrA protein
MTKVIIKENRYVDSVSLMAIGDKAMKIDGILSADALMGTSVNIETLKGLGFVIPSTVTANDLVIAVSGENEAQLDEAIKKIEDLLMHKNSDDEKVYHSLDEIDLDEEPYDLAQISIPGEYAAAEAMKALEMGLDVFIFSDNVSLEEELRLKEFGREKGLLVMGPDCGVGLIDGVALAVGSILRKGPVGIVGASGSGAQEVACIIEACGFGVSAIIGTGGRDLYPQIGGISMMEGIKRLDKDAGTEIIVLVSKLADSHVMEKVLSLADTVSKPVVAVFLGSDEKLFEGHRVHGEFSLEGAALQAVRLISGTMPEFGFRDGQIEAIVEQELKKYRPEQKYFRGLYCGGTFTEESLIYFSRHNQGVQFYSNLKNRYAKLLDSPHVSKGHAILDLGAEDFTAQAPHPVFDPAIRLKRFEQEAKNPEVAVIMLDFITGPGVHEDPVTPFAEVCKSVMKARGGAITFISNICGSYEDPQNIVEKEKLLLDAGVIVTKSNYQSTKLASALITALERRG